MKPKSSEKFVKVCPDCFSTQVTLTNRPALTVYRELYYRCRNCGLEAKLFPEVSIFELKKMTEQKKKGFYGKKKKQKKKAKKQSR